jgi:hypothetical protein
MSMLFPSLERFPAKACPGLDPGWIPVRVKKTRQNKKLSLRFDSIETEKALDSAAMVHEPKKRGTRRSSMTCPTNKE